MVPSIVQSSRISLGNVTKDSLPQLAELHKCVFPVSYGEKFYNEVLHADELAKISKLNY
jgi:hypothetical protein